MLLEKKEEIIQESGATYVTEICLYNSSNILQSKYNEKDKGLKIVFNNGLSYLYENVSFEDYFWFRSRDSQGKVLSTRLKPYSYKKTGKEDVEELIKRKKELI